MTPNRALEAALALSRARNMVRLFRRQPLPPGINTSFTDCGRGYPGAQ